LIIAAAIDDITSVKEIKLAWILYNVNCQGYSLAHSEYTVSMRSSNAKLLNFVTGLSILTDAAYFAGIFNVARLVTVIRGCNNHDSVKYSRSFGVDKDHWFMTKL
jgi:hypothetical protein